MILRIPVNFTLLSLLFTAIHVEAFSLNGIRHAAGVKTQECLISPHRPLKKQRGNLGYHVSHGTQAPVRNSLYSKNRRGYPSLHHFATSSPDDMSSSHSEPAASSAAESKLTADSLLNIDSQNGKRQKQSLFIALRKKLQASYFSKVRNGALMRFCSKCHLDNVIHTASTIPPPVQLLALVTFYVLHLTVLTQHSIIFPFQLIPNQQGRFQSIGLDSLAGILSFATIQFLRNRQLKQFSGNPDQAQNITIPSLMSSPLNQGPSSSKKVEQQRRYSTPSPWNFPTYAKFNALSPRLTSMTSLFLLVSAYFMTGRIANWVELNLYTLAGLGLPMTIAMHRSLVVLGGHLAWVMIGSAILGIILRPQPFFGGAIDNFCWRKILMRIMRELL
jgi:hypothetical protein